MKTKLLINATALVLALGAFTYFQTGASAQPPTCTNTECEGPDDCDFRDGQTCFFPSGGGSCDDDPC